MTTARQIIEGTLTIHLNRLAPGETLDDDTATRCLAALNDVCDEISSNPLLMYRQIMTSATVNGASGTLGTTWATIPSGTRILGATYGTDDGLIEPITIRQYHEGISDKSMSGDPQYWAHDGAATVYFWPAPVNVSIKLRTQEAQGSFADLNTDYTLPPGRKPHLQALLAEKIALVMTGRLDAAVVRAAGMARRALKSNVLPEIIGDGRRAFDILAG